jgi:hypothetical protein
MARRAAEDLDPRHSRELEKHLAACSECSGLEAQLESVWTILGHEQPLEPSAGALPRLKAMVRSEPGHRPAHRSSWSGQVWRWAAVAACALMAAVLFIWRGEPDRTSRAPDQAPSAGEHDRWDDQFLQDLDRALQRSPEGYLAAYDSWPGIAQEAAGTEAKPPAPRPEGRKKESL